MDQAAENFDMVEAWFAIVQEFIGRAHTFVAEDAGNPVEYIGGEHIRMGPQVFRESCVNKH